MADYVKLKDLISYFDIQEGDNVYISSDIKRILYNCIEHEDDKDMNIILDSIIDKIGTEGTLILPTFNWEYCKGKPFDYYKTACKTGALGKIALKRPDFKRTKHPIYSFAVCGKAKEKLCALENKSSFGIDSPFTFMKENNTKNLLIDVPCQHSFVFVHYVEEQSGNLPYRYLKNFTADYTDEQGVTALKTYSMNVRDLDKDVFITIYPYEEDFLKADAVKRYTINDVEFKMINLTKAYPIIEDDIKNNRSRKLCTYIGQEEEKRGD